MKKWERILYGGDYNPNQWPRDIWKEDMRLFKKAGINSATVNVFSWAKLQPSEETYDFSELDDIIEMLSQENCEIVLATSTAALPAWMVKRYPEVSRTDYHGMHHKFGQRHNACPNSPVYQRYSKALAEKLAQRYGNNSHIACWHVNNEYGGICYCENCEKAFRVWLRKKYGTLEALNKAWNTEFWGHTIYDWDEIVAPNALGDGIGEDKTAFAGLSIDYCRFNSDSILENFKAERDAIRKYDSETPITTNLMGTYKQLDYFKWAKEMDIVSWDNYPAYDTLWSLTAMRNDLMRGLKGKPFMLMEQTPSQQNWKPYNSLKRPGQMHGQSYQTIAHGANTIQSLQLRRYVGAYEQFHGAVIEHAGTENTRVFRETAQLGEELQRLSCILPTMNEAKVGILFDWENYWAVEYTSGPHKDLKYVDQIHAYYDYFYQRNIPVDMIPADGDFSRYSIIAAPLLYMVRDGMAQALETFVEKGGTLITGFMSGIVDQSDNVHLGGYPGPLRKMAGIWVEEIDALAPEQSNRIVLEDGSEAPCRMLCDLMHLEGARCLAQYGDDFYKGTPAVTQNAFGKGFVYYIGTVPDQPGLFRILDEAVAGACVEAPFRDSLLEITCRSSDTEKLYFLINFRPEPQPVPECFWGKVDLLSGRTISKGDALCQYEVRILRMPSGSDTSDA